MRQAFTENFIRYLQTIQNDRGKMATLRKGLIENQAEAAWPLLSRFINFDQPYQIKALQTAAGLFAHHSQDTDKGNFGSLCKQLLSDDERAKIAKGESGSISQHFQYALASNGDEIFARIKRLVLRAKRDEIAVNYSQLTDDLLNWNSYKKAKIKREWGKEFWKAYSDKGSAGDDEAVKDD